jgi:hypothetical protein
LIPSFAATLMRRGFVAAGLVLAVMASGLLAVARHDGILGVTPPESFPAPGHSADDIRTRVVVDGTPATSAALVSHLQAGGFLSSAASDEGPFVTAHFDRPGTTAIILLNVRGAAPSVGDVLVARGVAETYLAPPGSEPHGPILWLDAQDLEQPILFKEG